MCVGREATGVPAAYCADVDGPYLDGTLGHCVTCGCIFGCQSIGGDSIDGDCMPVVWPTVSENGVCGIYSSYDDSMSESEFGTLFGPLFGPLLPANRVSLLPCSSVPY